MWTVPVEIRGAFKCGPADNDVDGASMTWSSAAQQGLFRSKVQHGSHLPSGVVDCLGRGLVKIRSRRLGGTIAGLLPRPHQCNPVDTAAALCFADVFGVGLSLSWMSYNILQSRKVPLPCPPPQVGCGLSLWRGLQEIFRSIRSQLRWQ